MQYHGGYAISWQICYIRNTSADRDGSAARTKEAPANATARRRGRRRLGGDDGAAFLPQWQQIQAGFRFFPLREKHKHGVSFGKPLEFQNFTT